jgi:hypothetical protein
MNRQMRDVITVYIWFPKDFLGHVSMQVGLDTYISFWPNEDIIRPYTDHLKNQGHGAKSNVKKLWSRHFLYTTCDSYEKDCLDLGEAGSKREADNQIELFNLPQEPIKTFWTEFQTLQPSYNLLKRNCASVVAEAINESWKAYVSTRKIANNFLGVFETANEYLNNDLEALSFTTAALNLGKWLFWSPTQVWYYANMIKRLTE